MNEENNKEYIGIVGEEWWWRKVADQPRNYFVEGATDRILGLSPATMQIIIWRIAPKPTPNKSRYAKTKSELDLAKEFAGSIGYNIFGENLAMRYADFIKPSHDYQATSSQREQLIHLSESVVYQYRDILNKNIGKLNLSKYDLMRLSQDTDPISLIAAMTPALKNTTQSIKGQHLLKNAENTFYDILNIHKELDR